MHVREGSVGFTTFKKARNTPRVRVQAEFRPGEMWSCLQILNY